MTQIYRAVRVAATARQNVMKRKAVITPVAAQIPDLHETIQETAKNAKCSTSFFLTQNRYISIDHHTVPVGSIAPTKGPMVIRSEGTRPNAWVFVDVRGTDLGSYVRQAQRVVANHVSLPTGYTITWSGDWEYMQRSKKRLMIVIPLTILIIFIILLVNTKSLVKTCIVFLAVPFSLVGAFWILFFWGII
jgi:Cu/Ag efflux pump CusA